MKNLWGCVAVASLLVISRVGSADTTDYFAEAATETTIGPQQVPEVGPACEAAADLCESDWCPLWTVQAGAIVLHRSDPEDRTGILRSLNDGDVPSFEWAVGPEISIRRWLTCCDSLEVRYFGVWNFEIDEELEIPGAASFTSAYDSRLHSTEINWRRQTSDRVTLLAGFRWIELHENFSFNIAVPGTLVDFNSNTDNHLYGGQVGADVLLWQNCCWTVNTWGKAGAYANVADADFAIAVNGAPAAALRNDGTEGAFVGELGVAATYQLSDHWALRGGYQLLWIDGAVLADENFGSFDQSGDVFYHGALLGVELTW
ncbi:MAG: BBP7 family outer membrane beta-barrel protein [Planctomycetaceae bacterium]|nr:BBP7 family outer membrane beta-barrel protein [Planctomycetaceae bacterium]